MRVAALYDIHGMPWALEAVLAEVDADAIVFGGDYLYGPYPRETVAIIRSLDAQVLRGNCEDLAEEWERHELAAGDLEWLQSRPLVGDGRRRSLLPCGAGRQHADHDRRDARRRGQADVRRPHRHDRDRPHAPPVRPHVGDLRVVNAGSVGMAYEGDVAAYWTLVEDGEPRRCARPSTSIVPSAQTSASGWPHAPEFVAENLLVAVSREEAIASLESRR